MERPGQKLCHLHINEPDHVFDKGLKAEAERVVEELTRSGFPIRVELRYGRGDEKNQLHQPLTRMQNAEREAYGRRLFSVAADQREIGRIQARQFAAVLPGGAGDVLYVQGRQNSFATAQRMLGLLEERPRTGGVKLNGYRVYGDWSPESVRPAAENWKRLGGKLEWLGAAGAQSDDMALALAAHLGEQGRPLPVIGVDGLETGKRAVNTRTLAATVVQPLGVGHALRVYRDLVTGATGDKPVAEDGNIVLPPESYPALDELRRRASRAS